MQYFIISLVSLILFLMYLVWDVSSDRDKLVSGIEGLQTEKATRSLELNYCKSDLETQNDTIELIAKEYTLGLQEMEKLKAQPERVRYEKIYEIKEMRSDECEDIKRGIDLLRAIRVGV